MTKFRELRPFYVKDATRETCMCIYHLRWTEMANALLKYRQTCRAQGVSTCSCNFQTINDKWLRKGLCCQRDDGSQTVDNTRCVTNSCADCKDAKRLTEGGCGLCEDELRDPGSTEGKAIGIRYEKYTKIQYLTKVIACRSASPGPKSHSNRSRPFAGWHLEREEGLSHHRVDPYIGICG